MKWTPLRGDLCTDIGIAHSANWLVSSRRAAQADEMLMHKRTKLNDPGARADAIGQAAPFSAWPRAALVRLAGASSVSSHKSGHFLIVDGQRCDQVTVIADGAVLSSVSNPQGRRITFKFDGSAYAYGLAPLVDGLTLPHDLVADGQVIAVRIPYAAIRAELRRKPSLWESIAVEATRRGRGINIQMQRFVFDAPLVRAASLLLGLLASDGKDGEHGPVVIELRLPQERLAEMLGTSRQWAATVVRELSKAGVVEWRYGRVTVSDIQALRALANGGIRDIGQRNTVQLR